MRVRTFEERDIKPLGKLLSLAFGGAPGESEEYYDPERNPRLDPDLVYVAELDGGVRATATVLPLEVFVDGGPAPMGGVAAVATHPAYRRRRLAGELMRAVLGGMRERGLHLSMLDPFEHSFYRAYGWELAGDAVLYTLEPGRLARSPEQKHLRAYRGGDLARMRELYERQGQRHQLCVRRGEGSWRKILSGEELEAAVYAPGGEVEGYIIYRHKRWPEGRRPARTLVAEELVWGTPRSLSALLSFLGSYDSKEFDIRHYTSPAERLHPHLESAHVKMELEPDNMLRLVSVEGALRLLERSAAEPLVLEVSDEVLAENAGEYTLGGGEAVRGAEVAERVALDVRRLAQLYAGYLSGEQLVRHGLVRGTERGLELLQELFPDADPWLFPLDHF
ncbi:GNAT family N-acetyltransferase [Rubrobacter taiwanensis]|uniref:GNAT family N-acetyltransferase n=1 Tax=Rubrobacter taiwanensis TaxID=185139 RepID=A0A4R1BS00_9ACTN|nr:GNAT family N-acetyltransferase [Rubrobacter taiwanensis]TCJ20530.1 GNAT family N-acetyltransferase [Rubrobacter taiwanensis]